MSGDLPGDDERFKSSSALVSARGTSEGLVVRLDGRADSGALLTALRDFLETRKAFLRGSPVSVEWLGASVSADLRSRVERLFEEEFSIRLSSSKESVSAKLSLAEPPETEFSKANSDSLPPQSDFAIDDDDSASELGLFGGLSGMDETASTDAVVWDDADARVLNETLRSGQRVESEHSLVIFGDVNSGAEIVSGGDVIVLGKLKGVAHAGAYEESGGGRCIFALELDPIQLRIGSVISRGAEGSRKRRRKDASPEVARVDTDRIVVENYVARPRGMGRVGNF